MMYYLFLEKKRPRGLYLNYVKWFRRLSWDPSSTQRNLSRFVDEDSMDHDETKDAAPEKRENIP